MHLKSLTIQGFKSFPERTVIEFHKGVTAIIGPNGSGKSNVTDAIRWVLGEQSVRTLRGARMEDVIFTGTQSRRAMSFAEVTMTLDNSDQMLPLEYSEIQITRRLYRSGESEYLMNNTLCRLKDIAALFMDTGLGRDGYSIVGQGRVDDILSHRSEDRRKIFEEASGIVKYKTRKEETERKLAQTEQNLIRINDLIDELADRLEPLAEQASAARQYLNLRDELKSLEVALMLDTLDQYQAQLKEAHAEKDLLLNDLDNADQALVDLKTENRRTVEKLAALEQTIEAAQKKAARLTEVMAELKSKAALTEEKKIQLEKTCDLAAQEEETLQKSIDDLDLELRQREKRETTLLAQEKRYRGELEQAQEEMALLLQTLDEADKDIEAKKVKRDQLLEKLFEARNQLTETQSQTHLVDSRRRSIEQEVRELISDRDRLNLLLEENQEQINQIEKEKTTLTDSRSLCQRKLDEASQKLDDLRDALDSDRQTLQNSQYRRRTLQDLERNFEGYGDAVRKLLKKAAEDASFGKGVRGSLGSLIRVEQTYELAIETALGPAIQHVVTDQEQTAGRLIAWLKENQAGRATFLPIATIRARRLEADLYQKAKQHPDFLGLAADLIEAPDDLSDIVYNLLGRVLIVKHLDAAVSLARQLHHACRIVTLEGDVMNPGGSMTGGFQRRQSSGVLRRSREIEHLAGRILSLEKSVTQREQTLQVLTEEYKENGRQLSSLERQLVDVNQQFIREDARRQSLQEEQKRGKARQEMLEAEDLQLLEERKGIGSEVSDIKQRIKQMEQETESLRETIETQEHANRAEKLRRNDMRETITDMKVSLNSIQESLQSAKEMSERIGREQVTSRERLEKQKQTQTDSLRQIEWLKTERLALQVKIEDQEKQGAEVAEQLTAYHHDKEALEATQHHYFETLEQASSRLSSIQSEISRSEAKAGRIDLQMDEIKNRLWETYELTAEQAETWRQPIESRPEAGKRVQKIKQAMRDLGDVNLAAIEESVQVEKRHAFMTQQRDDIEKARGKLTSVIADLTEAMRQQFLDHFKLINENFNLVFAELFGGGMAEVNLEDDDDVLACGIEIKAQPPGKRLQNLMLLSGGERCLTAIALLFAILKLRPTPFCVLDEVEAALDDANVGRFTDYIRRYADDAQFILVTHRKGTMEAADRLYGVTMQERGISRILSMQLSD